jgi:predicted oxidoreductase
MERIGIAPGLDFSRIVYGMWRLGDDADTGARHVQAKVEACLAQGITTLDQADIYGGYTAEGLLGAAFRASPGLRDRVELVTKCDIVAPVGRHAAARVKHYDTSAAHIRASVETSLREMATDRIDLLLIHRPDPMIDPAETGACLDALVAEGKVRAVGVSNFRPWDFDLLQSRMATPLATNQIELSLMHRAPFTDGDMAHLLRLDRPVMAWSPLAGGRMFGDDPAARRLAPVLARMGAAAGVAPDAVAVAWLLAHPGRILPVMGTNDLGRIARLSDALRPRLSRQDWYELWTAAAGAEVP